MRFLKKTLCTSLTFLILPLTGCDTTSSSKIEQYKLNIKDLNNIILNLDELCEPNESYGYFEQGTNIQFEIPFYSGINASLLIDEIVYSPQNEGDSLESQYINYIMPSYDVNVVSLLNGYTGEEVKLCETLSWGSSVTDESLVCVDVQFKRVGVAPGSESGVAARVYNEEHSISQWFNNALIREENSGIDGGSSYLVTFVLNDGTSYELNVINNYIRVDGKTYVFPNGLPSILTPDFDN